MTYYVVIFGGQSLLRDTKPLTLNFLVKVHNLFLTILSFILFVLMTEQVIPMIIKKGIVYSVCDPEAWTQPLVTLYYLNYIVKFIEFIDTVFLVLKHKKLTFLHTYHHGATALLCFTQLIGKTAVSWVPIVLNLGVHVVMYWYYFLCANGIKVPWKAWVTRFQIVQFILDVAFIYFVAYQKFTSVFFPQLSTYKNCSGTISAICIGSGIITSYLFLFIGFYIHAYRKNARKGVKKTYKKGKVHPKTI